VIRWLAVAMAIGSALGAVTLSTLPLRHADPPAASRPSVRPRVNTRTSGGGLRVVTVLAVACMPLAFYADVLEVALPVTLVQTLHASPAWSSGIFVGNTVLVIVLQVPVVVGLSGRPHRTVLAASGFVLAGSYLGFWLGTAWGGAPGVLLVATVALPYTLGEILYTGSSVPLVMDSVPAHLTGRALARWQFSYGLARAADPIIITGLLAIGSAALWAPLTAATVLSAAVVVLSGRAGRAERVHIADRGRP
jgi:hypothetical protein